LYPGPQRDRAGTLDRTTAVQIRRSRNRAFALAAALALAAGGCRTIRVPYAPGTADPRTVRLPLTEMPASGPGAVFAIVLTGDGIFPGLADDLGRSLSRGGFPAVVWSSMRYYIQPHSPAHSAADLDRVIRWYRQRWHRDGVVLVGYSMGADVLPFMVNRLPPDTRRAVRGIALLGAADDAVFVFEVEEWWGPTAAPTLPSLPEIQKLSVEPRICAYGDGDDEAACDQFSEYLRVVHFGGGHHFKGEEERVKHLVLQLAQNAENEQFAQQPPAPAAGLGDAVHAGAATP
jgi:type IV secretory pathway VirJ component